MNAHPLTAAAAEVASQCACFALRRATRAVTRMYDRALEPAGLRITRFTLLVALSRSRPLTLGQLAERLAMDGTTLTRNVAPLERDRLVKSDRGPDRRERHPRLTRAGPRALGRTLPLWHSARARPMTAIDPRAWRALCRGRQAFTTAVRVRDGERRRP